MRYSVVLPDLVMQEPSHWGLLPPGVHPASLSDIKYSFVEAIESCRRQDLFNDWLAWREAIHALIDVKHEYLDGSFVTSRANPKDIDVSIWVDGNEFLSLSDSKRRAITLLFGEGGIELFGVDSYLVPVSLEGDLLYGQFVEYRDWTQKAWATARDKRQKFIDRTIIEKGYVEIIS